jgi:hypothetical protein
MPVELARTWQWFVKRYSRGEGFWYVPKGATVDDLERLAARLTVLKDFDGAEWSSVQKRYVRELGRRGLFNERAGADSATAIARMLKVVFSMLGFAWVDDAGTLRFLPAGKAFLKPACREEVLDLQLWRHEFGNREIGVGSGFFLFPHAFLVRLLLDFEDGITSDEYNLFVARAAVPEAYEKVSKAILRWRNLTAAEQAEVRAQLQNPVGPSEGERAPVSLLTRIERHRSYAWAFHAASGRNVVRLGSRIAIPREQRAAARATLDEHTRHAEYVSFSTRAAWFEFFGELPFGSGTSPYRLRKPNPVRVKIPPWAVSTAHEICKARQHKYRHRFVTKKLKDATADDPAFQKDAEGVIGYLGDICACIWLGIDPKEMLRGMIVATDLLTHRDECDLTYNGWRVDVKTELYPKEILDKIVSRTICPTERYGCRLINEAHLRENSDTIDLYVFATLDSEADPRVAQYWYPVGWATREEIKKIAPEPKWSPPSGGKLWSPAHIIPNIALDPPETLSDIAKHRSAATRPDNRVDPSKLGRLNRDEYKKILKAAGL